MYWDGGTADLPPYLPDGTSRTRGPLFLSERRPVPAVGRPPRAVAADDCCRRLAALVCPITG
ncbi:hypothetical protein AB0J63_39475 [Streptosporangium canum]|uniref:hypothetical protein n=1 Tax=Streptosporangium canum TaxID=324952 RepID=UPI00342FEBC0